MINLIKNITEKIAEDIFDKLCANVAQLSQCAADPAFISSIKPDDTNLKALFNLNHVGTFITRMCALKNDLYANKNCPSDIIIPIGVCAYLPTIWDSSSTEIPLFSGTVISDTQVNSFCPKMGDLFRCAAIQVAPCNPSLAAMVKSLSTDLLITTCSNLAMEGAQYPTSSPLLVCAVPHVTKVLPLAVTVESIPGDPTTFQIQELIGDAINIACAILPDYFMCVREELPSSKNRFDMFIKELIDVNQFTYGTAIANLMCDAGRVKAITDMIPCVITKAIDIEACGTAERIMVFDNFNITNLAHDANKDRQEFCGPIKELAMCIFDAILVPCNADVGAFAKEAFYWAMQTDCYGARNGTFQKVIDEQKRNGGTPVAIGNARIYWLGVLLASVLIYRA
ncbi:uncharacterized protein LOC110442363 [Mizuhopecten yessoensis]|uniref:uncharacterized protein LOC110442363 n=1 Tax=Mizuhopecten yessoensis TaxID=6573 RepID=UPI000B4599DF|nr:uncharacterized protein LOC110442363 [Mizuhopecten yessoensis]